MVIPVYNLVKWYIRGMPKGLPLPVVINPDQENSYFHPPHSGTQEPPFPLRVQCVLKFVELLKLTFSGKVQENPSDILFCAVPEEDMSVCLFPGYII